MIGPTTAYFNLKLVDLNDYRFSSPYKYVALDVNGRRLRWPTAFSGWSQMADGHLSQSQKASHWPFRPRL